jgi:hypothetical protein
MRKVLIENLLEVERIKLIINYDVSRTLTENLFTEQKTDFSGYDALNPMNQNYGKSSETPMHYKNWDIHDWFTLTQLTLMALGFATGGVTSIIAMALGGILDLSEAIVFWKKDNDPYMATVMVILSTLGINDLMKIPIVKKYGIEGTKELIKKSKEGTKLTIDEIKDLKTLGEHIVKNAGNIIPLFKNGIKRKILQYLSKKSAKQLMNLLLVLNKTKYPLLIAGTWIPFDYVYIYVFRDDIEKLNLRNENSFIKVIKFVESKLSGKEITTDMVLPNFKSFDISEFKSIKNDSLIESVSHEFIQKYRK